MGLAPAPLSVGQRDQPPVAFAPSPRLRAPCALSVDPPALAGRLIAGCGDDGSSSANRPVTLALDFQPNAVHAAIYATDHDPGSACRPRAPTR